MLNAGETIDKHDISIKFGVSERTIQRDIDDIRAFFVNNTLDICYGKEVVYDRIKQGYQLKSTDKELLTNSEILALCKILLESRSLIKSEMQPILDKIIQRCVSEGNKKTVINLINNELFHYIEPRHNRRILDKLWDIGLAIKESRYIQITYTRASDKKTVKRKLKPVGIMVSEFYFYLTAFIENIDKKDHFENPDDLFPTIYRIDRINSVEIYDERFSMPYCEHFEEGEFRKRIQFMYGGKLQTVKFTYSGYDINAVLDRLPTAQILSVDENGVYTVSAEVFGKGIDMWLRSQGESVSLLEI